MNTQPYFSDLLPVAMVRSWMQCRRSPLYLLAVAALLALSFISWEFPEADTALAADKLRGIPVGTILMLVCGLVPLTAGLVVRGDVGKNNFMRLAPVSSVRMVWGIWLSFAVQAFILAGVYAVSMYFMDYPIGYIAYFSILLLAFSCGLIALWMLAMSFSGLAFLMTSAGVAGLSMTTCGWFYALTHGGMLFDGYIDPESLLHAFTGSAEFSIYFLLLLVPPTVLFLSVMTQARNAYAGPTENLVLWTRLGGLVSLLCSFLLPEPRGLFASGIDIVFVGFYFTLAVGPLMMEAVLPVARPCAVRVPLPGFPAFLQRPGAMARGVWMLLYIGLGAAGIIKSMMTGFGAESLVSLLLFLGTMYYVADTVTTLSCSSSSGKRLPVFAITMVFAAVLIPICFFGSSSQKTSDVISVILIIAIVVHMFVAAAWYRQR